jgi:hypothetical protein
VETNNFGAIDSNKISDIKTNYSYTFDQYKQNKEVILKFEQTLPKNTFNYELLTDNYYTFQISKD